VKNEVLHYFGTRHTDDEVIRLVGNFFGFRSILSKTLSMLKNVALLLLIFVTFNCYCQKRLMFRKNKHKVAYYYTGDVLTFRLKGDKSKIKSQIREFTDSLIVFKYYTINPKDISHLYVDDKTKIWYVFKYKTMLLTMAGAGYLLLDVINTGELDEGTVVVGSSLIASGFLLKWVLGNTIRIKGKRS
jgi:hypothetical protein